MSTSPTNADRHGKGGLRLNSFIALLKDKTSPLRMARVLVYAAAVVLGAYAIQLFGQAVFDLLFFAAIAFAVIASIRDPEARKYPPSFLLCVGLLVIGGALTAFLNPDPFSTIKRLSPVPYLFALWLPLFAIVISRLRHLRILYIALVISAALTGMVALLQATVDLALPSMSASVWGRMTGLLRHPPELGSYCAIVLPLGYSLVVLSRSLRSRILWLCLVTIAVLGIILSVSMTGVIAAGLGLLAFFLFSPSVKKRKTWLVLGGVCVLLVVGWVLLKPVLERIGVKLITDRLPLIGNSGDPSVNTWLDRLEGDRAALEYIGGRPFVGHAIDTSDGLLVHNGFLRFWYELGLFGFLAVFTLLVLAVRSLFARFTRPEGDAGGREHRWLRAGAVASFVAFFAAFLVSPILTDRSLSIAVAVAFAFCSASGGRISFTGRRARRELLKDGSKQPRIAVVYHYFPHYRAGICRELARVHDVTFVGDSWNADDGIPRLSLDAAAEFIEARYYRVGRALFQPRAISIALFGRFDVFVFLADPWFLTTWCAALVCRLRGKRVVFWGHGFYSNKQRFRNLLRAVYFSLAHGFYSYGYRSKVIAQRYRFKPQRLYVGHNSLDYLAQLPLREHCQALPELQTAPAAKASRPLRIVCVSRLTHGCRYDLLLSAMAEARDTAGLNAVAVFFGDGPARADLEELAKVLGVRAVFKGTNYDDTVIAPIIYSADVTVSPGKVGLAAIHSMMFGTPVISHGDFESQMPEVETIVEGYSGMLFDRNAEGDLARALVDYHRVFPDRERARENCFAVVDWFYNPLRQSKVFLQAVRGLPADEGNDMQRLFPLRGPDGFA